MKESQISDLSETENELMQIQLKLNEFDKISKNCSDYLDMNQLLYRKRSALYDKINKISQSIENGIRGNDVAKLRVLYRLDDNLSSMLSFSSHLSEATLAKLRDRKKEIIFTNQFNAVQKDIKECIDELSRLDLIKSENKQVEECISEIRENSAQILNVTKKIISLFNIDKSKIDTTIKYSEFEIKESKECLKNEPQQPIQQVSVGVHGLPPTYFANNNKIIISYNNDAKNPALIQSKSEENTNKVEEAKDIENPQPTSPNERSDKRTRF